MSSLKITAVLLCLLAIFAVGCADINSENSFSAEADGGTHPDDGWVLTKHALKASGQMENCATCHGEDFRGGISKSDCMECHMGNESKKHPLEWGEYEYAEHSGYVDTKGIGRCANINCHGPVLTGVENSGKSCWSCHIGGPLHVHPVYDMIVWAKDASEPDSHAVYVKENGNMSCAKKECHGEYLEGNPRSGGMACITCHAINM